MRFKTRPNRTETETETPRKAPVFHFVRHLNELSAVRLHKKQKKNRKNTKKEEKIECKGIIIMVKIESRAG